MLSPKRARFVEEYLIDFNATQAAIRAGYSARDAHNQGARLSANVGIKAEIDKALADRSKRNIVDQNRIIEELAAIAFSDITGIVRFENGKMIIEESANLTDNQRRAILEMSESITEGGRTRKVKLHDKLRALELLGKHLAMFRDRVDINVNNIADLFRDPKADQE